MAKCKQKDWPELFGYLKAYGIAQYAIDRIDRIKGDDVTCYYVVAWKDDDGGIHMMDLSRTKDRSPISPRGIDLSIYGWNMLNDGFDEITEADWQKLRIWDECEGFTIPGHPHYGDD
jgi:hypothetical protein